MTVSQHSAIKKLGKAKEVTAVSIEAEDPLMVNVTFKGPSRTKPITLRAAIGKRGRVKYMTGYKSIVW